MSDRLLLLERGGETVYFGDIGPDSRVLRDYFARHGAVCPPNMNPAEYMLEAIGAGVSPRIGDRDWKDVWLDSPECAIAIKEIQDMKAKALAKPVQEKVDKLLRVLLPITREGGVVPADDILERPRSD